MLPSDAAKMWVGGVKQKQICSGCTAALVNQHILAFTLAWNPEFRADYEANRYDQIYGENRRRAAAAALVNFERSRDAETPFAVCAGQRHEKHRRNQQILFTRKAGASIRKIAKQFGLSAARIGVICK